MPRDANTIRFKVYDFNLASIGGPNARTIAPHIPYFCPPSWRPQKDNYEHSPSLPTQKTEKLDFWEHWIDSHGD